MDIIIETTTPMKRDFSEEYFACSGRSDPNRCAQRTFDASEIAMTMSSARSQSSPTRPQIATSAGPCIAAKTNNMFPGKDEQYVPFAILDDPPRRQAEAGLPQCFYRKPILKRIFYHLGPEIVQPSLEKDDTEIDKDEKNFYDQMDRTNHPQLGSFVPFGHRQDHEKADKRANSVRYRRVPFVS
eukprot:CAMPEP_0201255556 /NCGR_PEP_ID=MMETSP0852-20130820/68539_1 /ASSEMBLY_ACC=CAM_ASM_000632 /TAXON_ID=183588 /ORGANISM="Pseudo-nitzschia fraudulenta, Strain WWA7" /LENGTH=183 /DNA_ID=CAMNT_0047555399 /DNA_START=1063 /DNA_END=1611 /DNA_ORIENTATION=+